MKSIDAIEILNQVKAKLIRKIHFYLFSQIGKNNTKASRFKTHDFLLYFNSFFYLTLFFALFRYPFHLRITQTEKCNLLLN